MTVSFKEIEKKFEEIFGFIRRDLEGILTLHPGANYAVASLFACACETLAIYRHRKKEGEIIFKELLFDDRFQGTAKTLYDALRNGLVHRYRAKDIEWDGKTIEIDIAWRKTPHLKVYEKKGDWHLVLNVRNLCYALFTAFDKYEAELRNCGEARDGFLQTYRKGSKKNAPNGEIGAWRKILKQSE